MTVWAYCVGMTNTQHYRVIADRDKGDDPQWGEVESGDRVWFSGKRDDVDRIERPVAAMTARTPDRADLTRYQFSNAESYYLATGRRTAPTPEQMRVLAYELEGSDFRAVREGGAALRAVADQLDATGNPHHLEDLHARWHSCDGNMFGPGDCGYERCDFYEAAAFTLTAGSAPQEGRMSKCDWPECPGYPTTVEAHEIESGPELHPQCKDAILLAERARREGWHTAPREDRDE